MPDINRMESWILKTGRRFCLIIGALAVVAIVLGVLSILGAGAYWVFGKPTKPVAPAEPITLNTVRQSTKRLKFDQASTEVPEVQRATLRQVEPLKDLFPAPEYTWEEVVQDYCRVPSSYGCLEHGRRVTRAGIARFLARIIESIDHGGHDAMVQTIGRVLKDAPVAERGDLVVSAVAAELERSAEIQHQDAEYAAALESHRSLTALMGTSGATGITWGILAAVGISLLAAVLAIERHLRSGTTAE